MIVITTNQNDFEVDIYSLAKAFFPAEEVKVYLGDEAGKEEFSSSPGLPDINIHFLDTRILLTIHDHVSDQNLNATAIEIGSSKSRLEVKNALKQLLYCGLSNHTGFSLPWGALTGVRPVKIPMKLLEEKYGLDDIIDHMKNTYLCSEEKARLALGIAEKEREVLNGLDLSESYSLYIAIPFCPTTCLYCSFTSYPIIKYKDMVEIYLEALFKEIDFIADYYREKKLLTVYIGGGTPTTLSAATLEKLLDKIGRSFDLSHLKEYTIEAGRPDSLDVEKLTVMKKYYVNRISINPQSMNDETLKTIGRNHTVSQVYETFSLAREIGFDNINMDIILGLPGESINEVQKTLTAISEMKPESLTVHSLSVKRAAKLTDWVNEHGLESLKNTEEMMKAASICANELGMFPYYLYRQKNIAGNFENVGYAVPGKEGLYNILMMEDIQTIVALGAGSISKQIYPDGNVKRCDNLKEVDQYITRINEMLKRKRKLLL